MKGWAQHTILNSKCYDVIVLIAKRHWNGGNGC